MMSRRWHWRPEKYELGGTSITRNKGGFGSDFGAAMKAFKFRGIIFSGTSCNSAGGVRRRKKGKKTFAFKCVHQLQYMYVSVIVLRAPKSYSVGERAYVCTKLLAGLKLLRGGQFVRRLILFALAGISYSRRAEKENTCAI